ncbi:MAG: molybdopterin molybdotransferase MoeA [Planctomycetes bacterium]|nr:molybdopterin molybdotransferase MoeA [Planctomycetota bacterium]
MMEVSEAVAAVLRETWPFEPQAILLLDALGLVLAEDVCANEDSPPFDKSLVDGFAVRLADCVTPLPVIEIVAAGQVPTRLLDCPAAIQIMTGAPLPAGAEAVIPVEHTSQTIGADERPLVALPSSVTSWKLGTNILRRGASTKLGDLVVAAGSELRPQELGTLAECGLSHVTARRRPRVAVLATGDELVPVEQTLGPGQIRNSNETMLCGQLLRACAEPVPLGIARDERVHLRERIDIGLQADVLVLSGGVSMGDKDLVPSELASAGVRQVFHKANVKPGKPIWFGVLDRGPNLRTLVFGLPGNPVSSLVCFELFVRPALRRMMGVSPAESVAVKARLTVPHTTKGERPTYQPARLEWQSDGPIVTAVPWVGSSDLRATVAANSMALFPIGDQTYEPGSTIEVIVW